MSIPVEIGSVPWVAVADGLPVEDQAYLLCWIDEAPEEDARLRYSTDHLWFKRDPDGSWGWYDYWSEDDWQPRGDTVTHWAVGVIGPAGTCTLPQEATSASERKDT